MMKRRSAIAAILGLAVGVTYVGLDVADIAPGVLTTRPAIADPQPYPSPDGSFAPVSQAAAPTPVAANSIDGAVAEFLATPEIGTTVGFEVIDASTGQVVASHNANVAIPPASSTKLLTAAAALSALGPETRLPTTTVLSDSTVVLVGGGDLLLGTGPAAAGADGHASLTDLADQTAQALAARGITQISLGVDDTLFEGIGPVGRQPTEWQWIIDMVPLALHGGYDGTRIQSRVDYAMLSAQTLAAELQARGITVTETNRMTAPAHAELVGAVYSAPIEDVVGFMLRTSNNSVAEALARLVAIARGEGSTAEAAANAVENELTELGLPMQGVNLQDTSGLSEYNQITPTLLAAIVQRSYSGDPALDSIIGNLPISFTTGTLDDRLGGAAGNVHAKTGALSTVTSLSGLVNANSGAVLIFSVTIANLPDENWLDARAAMDTFVQNLQQEK